MNHTHTNFGILIGTPLELTIDFRRLEQVFAIPAIAKNLKLISVTDPLQVIHSLHLDEHGYREFCGDVPLHTDNEPILEFSSPLSFYQYNETFRDNLEATMQYRPRNLRQMVNGFPDERANDWRDQETASHCFCNVVVHFYGFLIHRGRNELAAAIQSLKSASDFAKRGMETLPKDVSRERFYVQFFEMARAAIE